MEQQPDRLHIIIGNRDGGTGIYSGSLGLQGNTVMKLDGGIVGDTNVLNLNVGNGPPTQGRTLIMPVDHVSGATILTNASQSGTNVNTVGVLTGLSHMTDSTLTDTTAVSKTANSKTNGFVGNLIQLDSSMSTASTNYNIILARSLQHQGHLRKYLRLRAQGVWRRVPHAPSSREMLKFVPET